MLLGKMLRGLTGTPMRRMALAKSSLADAEPGAVDVGELDDEVVDRLDAIEVLMRPPLASGATCRRGTSARPASCGGKNFCMSQAPVAAALGAQPAVQADVLVLDHPRAASSAARETYRSCARFVAGAFRRVRRSASSPLATK